MQTIGKILSLAAEKGCALCKNVVLLAFGGIQKIQCHWGPLCKAFKNSCIANSHCFTNIVRIVVALYKYLG